MENTKPLLPVTQPWYRRKLFKIVGCLFVLLMIGGILLTYVPTQDDSLKLQATSIKANNNASSSHSISSTNHAMLVLQRIAVINQSDSPIMRRVSEQLAQQLKTHRSIDSVSFIDATQQNQWFEDGSLLEDMYIILDMPQFKESGLLATGRDIKATIRVSFSQSVGESKHGFVDGYTSPAVRIEGQIKLEHQSTSTGYESADASYQCVIDDITKQLHEQLSTNFQKWAKDFPRRSDIPDAFFPAYQPTPDDLPLPDHPTLKQVFTGRQLLADNQTTWTLRVEDGKASAALFDAYTKQLQSNGWRINDFKPKRSSPMDNYHLRTSQDNLLLEMFEDRHRTNIDDEKPIDIVIRYSQRVDRKQMAGIIDKLIADDALSMQDWITFERLIPRKTNDRLVKEYLDKPSLPVDVELKVIEYLSRHKRKDQALERLELVSGVALMLDSSKYEREIEDLGRQITDNKEWEAPKVTEESFKHAGIQWLKVDQEITTQTNLGEPVMWYAKIKGKENEPEKLVLISTVITPASIPEGKYEHATSIHMARGGHSRTSSTRHNPPTPWSGTQHTSHDNHSWIVNARELEDGNFELKISCQKQKQKQQKGPPDSNQASSRNNGTF